MRLELRQNLLMKLTRKLIISTCLSLAIILTFLYFCIATSDRSYLTLLIFATGLVGGFVSIQQRVHKITDLELRHLSESWASILLIPIYGGIFIFSSMASLGLPGLNGFVSEFLVVRGIWPVFTGLTILSMLGLLITGNYILKAIRAVLHGPFNMHWRDYHLEIELREVVAIAPLLVLMLVTGIVPNWILPIINSSVTAMLGLGG